MKHSSDSQITFKLLSMLLTAHTRLPLLNVLKVKGTFILNINNIFNGNVPLFFLSEINIQM